MKFFETILDVALLPVSVVKDVFDPEVLFEGRTSNTRRQVRKIDEDLEG